jgi:DNA-binding GntR family transcriptional regulator
MNRNADELTGHDGSDRNAVDEVYFRLKQQIASLERPPATAYREATLQEQLGTRAGILREVLHRLQHENMLRIYPRHGVRIATLGVSDIREIYEVRLALETTVAGLAAQRRSGAELTELEALAGEVCASQPDEDQTCHTMSHRPFHLLIARCARNRMLERYLEHSLTMNEWLWNIYAEARGERYVSSSSHDEIVAAIAAGDPAAAEAAARAHVLKSKERLLAGL